MTAHKLEGDRCMACGQVGLELEDECPVEAVPVARARPAPPVGAPSGARVPSTRPTPARWSFNHSQNMRSLERAAAELANLAKVAKITAAELLAILEKHGMDVKHVDQRGADL